MTRSLPPAMLAQLAATFRAEAADRLREMQAVLDADAVADQIDVLFRHAHSLKGAAAAIGRTEVAQLAHEFESRLEAARGDPSAVDRLSVQAMLDDLGHAINPQDHAPAAAAPEPGADPTTEDAPSPPASGGAGQEEVVRVGARGLDAIAADVGDLALTTEEWRRLAATSAALAKRVMAATRADAVGADHQVGAELASLARSIREQTRRTDRLVEHVSEQLETVRMQRVDGLLETLAREARRLARQLARPVHVVVEGGDVQADRRVIDRLRDPLLHLVRNAVDHAADASGDGQDGQHRRELTVRVSASTVGSSLVVEVADDGRGLDLDVLRERARDRGLDIDHLDDDGVRGLIFAPGFSTATEVTQVSGRGVGLTAVRDEVEALYGSVAVSSELDRGSTFRVEVPQGISGVQCLIVGVGDRLLAIPVTGVLTVRAFAETAPSRVGGRAVMVLDGVARPVVSGATFVEDAVDGAARYGVVIVHAGRTSVLAVDELVAQLPLVVKQLPPILGDVEGVSGVAVLGDGDVVPVLLPSALVGLESVHPVIADGTEGGAAVAPPRLLVVDDSSTTRTLIRTILSAAGFEVETASDGREGLARLQAGSHDLVVSDIEMPRMDGFELTRAIRSESGLAHLPIVLVSSRSDADDRARSAAAGADVHLDKRAFDQGRLVSAIRELLG